MARSRSLPRVPLDLSSFVGREAELERLSAGLAGSRLLTLTGPGGSGKTRLALELLRRREAAQSVFWVELADVTEGEGVAHRFGQATGTGADTDTVERMVDALPDDTLIGLDNCEHVVEAAACLVRTLLQRRPGARVLATSREPLGLPGEHAWLVPPLSMEDDGEVPEAVRLFVERAREVYPGFELGEENRAVVHAICRDLDGIPLAIELAAARTRVLSPAQIHARLHDALDLLSRGGRTTVPRHRTLRATLDWSHELLDDESARLLRRLAVFHGGASLEAVEAVGGDQGADPLDTLEALSRLVDRSWVTVREVAGVPRYHLLETVRMYAAEQLEASGEARWAHGRHAAFVTAVVEEARPHFTGAGRRSWIERLTPELANLRSALGWTLAHEPEVHLRLASSLWWFWFSSRHWEEARRWLEGAVALPEARRPDRRRAELLFAMGALDALQGRSAAARPWLEEALDLAGTLGDASLAAYVRVYLGMVLAQVGDPEAEHQLEPARDWLAREGDLYLLRLAQILLGSAYANRGDMPAALEVTRDGVATARAFGQDRELGISLQALGILLYQSDQIDEARARLLESLAALERDPSIMFLARTLHFVALCDARDGAGAEAVRLLAAAEAGRAGIGVSVVPIDVGPSAPVVAALRERLGPAGFDAAWREGAALDLSEVVRVVLAGRGPAAHPATPVSGRPDTASSPEVGADSGARESPGAVPNLRVRVLGTFEVEVDGDPMPAARWPYARPRELLALLLLRREGLSRDQIAEALWPEAGPAQAKNSVHVTLHHLRKAIGRPEWIEVVEGRYRLSSTVAVEVDADLFERTVSTAGSCVDRLRAAVELYRGDLLADEVPARWFEERADHLRRLHREAVIRLGTELEGRGDDGGAESLYAGLAARDALDEEVHRRLMALWSRGGDRARALAHFGHLAARLQDEFDAGPEAATLALVDRIRSGEEPKSPC